MDKKKIWTICDKLGILSLNDKIPTSKVEKKTRRYDVVSFDIFDTLIFRTVDIPADVFDLVGKEIGNSDFKKMRIDAEEEARKNTAGREPNIKEIYDRLSIENAEKALSIELDMEQQVCVCNPYMLDVMNALSQIGKEIIVVSDMYLSSAFLKKILEGCGYKGFTDVFVSNEYRASKYNGELYKLISRDYLNGKKVMHIGDNMHSDYLMALENGWKALRYERN